MIWNLISSIIVTIFILILGSFVYFRDRESSTHKAFFAMSICIVGWIVFLAISYLPWVWTSKELYFITIGLCQGFGNFIALFAFHFLYFFPQRKAKIPWWEIVFVFIPAIVLTYFTVFTRLVFYDVEFGKGVMGLPLDNAGPLYPVVVIWLSTTVIAGIIAFYLKFRKTQGKVKMQMRYVFLGAALFAAFTLTTNQFLPLIFDLTGVKLSTPTSILGYWGALIFASFVTYAIAKHRLMDIRLVIVKSIAYSFLILAISSLYLFVILYLKDPLASRFQISPNVTFILTGLLLVLVFSPIKRLIEKLTDRWLYKGRYNPSKLLDKIGDITNSILLLEPLLNSLLQTLTSQMKISKMAILLDNQSQTLGYKVSSRFSFNNFLKLLGKENISVTDELEEESPVKENLRKLNISLLTPLLMEQKPIGLLVLGDKKSGDAYTNEDINFLILLSHQIAVAINNALSFQEVIEDKEEINKLLQEKKKWLKRKQELIAIAVHEMNTPVAAVEGFLSILIHEKLGNLPPQMKDYLKKAYLSSRESASLIKQVMEAAEFKESSASQRKIG